MKRDLRIYPNSEVLLPQYLENLHNGAVSILDELSWLVTSKECKALLQTKVVFEKHGVPPIKEEEDIFDYLDSHSLTTVKNEIVVKRLVHGLVEDAVSFLGVSLAAASDVNMTVAIVLLRKPFLENLLLLEQILVDSERFLDRFSSEPNQFDPGAVKKDEKMRLIQSAVALMDPNYIYDPELLFDLRYDKENFNSFYAATNMATHLVTTRVKSYKTNSFNLNYVFSGWDERESQLNYYYYLVPYVMSYLAEVVDCILLKRKMIKRKKFRERKFFRLLGQVVHHGNFREDAGTANSAENELAKRIKVKCASCKRINKVYKSDLYSMAVDRVLNCKFCLDNVLTQNENLKILVDSIYNK